MGGGAALAWSVFLPSGPKDLCAPNQGPNHSCECEVYPEAKVMNLAGPLTQPQHTEHIGLVALLLPSSSGATCQGSAAAKK